MGSEYAGHNPEQLYAMVEQAAQGLEPTYAQVGALYRAQQALDAFAEALTGLRAGLVQQWPPESSTASAAYLAELDRLSAAVTETSTAASTNAGWMRQAADAIAGAREPLRKVRDEYVNNAAQLASYEETIATAGTAANVVSGPIVGWVSKGAARLILKSPVPDGRQQQLERQAQQHLDDLGDVARKVAAQLQMPPEYIAPEPSRNPGPGPSGGDDGGAARPPRIDPPAHTRATSTSHTRSEPDAGTHVTTSAASTVLATTATTAATAPLIPPTVPAQPSTSAPVRVPMPMAPNLGPLAGPMGREVLPPGGRIDGGVRTFGSSGTPAERMPGRVPPRVVNPVGGVIGGERAGAGPGMGMLGGQRGSRAESEGSPPYRCDPDNPWAVAEGVPPVIGAPQIPPVTLEPGVIGIDR